MLTYYYPRSKDQCSQLEKYVFYDDIQVREAPELNGENLEYYIRNITALCPRSGYPDMADFYIFVKKPTNYVREGDLWRLLNRYRYEYISHENITMKVWEIAMNLLKPENVVVEGIFYPRGNLYTRVTAGTTIDSLIPNDLKSLKVDELSERQIEIKLHRDISTMKSQEKQIFTNENEIWDLQRITPVVCKHHYSEVTYITHDSKPAIASVFIIYQPKNKVLELKSLKMNLNKFRNTKCSLEDILYHIAKIYTGIGSEFVIVSGLSKLQNSGTTLETISVSGFSNTSTIYYTKDQEFYRKIYSLYYLKYHG